MDGHFSHAVYRSFQLQSPRDYCYWLLHFSRPNSVTERLVCHAIIGKNAHKERIMTVDILANFIAPLTQFSTREISFTSHQVSLHI